MSERYDNIKADHQNLQFDLHTHYLQDLVTSK